LAEYNVDVHAVRTLPEALPLDILEGLTSVPRKLSPKYFYDSVGSALFERITRVAEYYPARTERAILADVASELMDRVRPHEIVELGSGYAVKIRTLIEADGGEYLARYVPFDVDEETVEIAAESLTERYPFLYVHGVVGDFNEHLDKIPAGAGRRLVTFFGSTIGNLEPPERQTFLTKARELLKPDDCLLLGVDLAKDTNVLNAAYNDTDGVTAEFNRNMLRVINRTVDGNFDAEAFQHHAFFNEAESRIEMHLIADTPQTVTLGAFGETIEIAKGDDIWTESSYKFTRESAIAALNDAGFHFDSWYTDENELFALILASRG